MSQFSDGNYKAFTAAAAIPQYARVTFGSGGTITKSGLAEKDIGTAQQAAFAAGDVITVKLRTAAGTHKMIAANAFTKGDPAYTAADGEIADSASTAYFVGTVLETASADQDIVEVIYNAHGDTAAS